jgi:hypothetical protein
VSQVDPVHTPNIPLPEDPLILYYTYLKNMHTHNNEGADVLSDYPVL